MRATTAANSLRRQEEDVTVGNEERLRDVGYALKRLNVGRTFLYGEVSQGRIACVRLGRSPRFRDEDIEEYIRRHQVPVGGGEPPQTT